MKSTVLGFGLTLLASMAQASGEGHSAGPLRGPWIPQSARIEGPPPPETRGDALRAQVERKLQATFAAADSEGRGSITRDQARAAHLGIVADNFEQIDQGRTGRVSFEDLKRYLRQRGARTLQAPSAP